MPSNFYVGTDAEVAVGSANFVTVLTPNIVAYGVTSAQLATYNTYNTAYQAAYMAAKEVNTRTKPNVTAKNTAKSNLTISAKYLSSIIRSNMSVTDSQLVALGLQPRNLPAPAPFPTSVPAVEIISCTGRLVKIRVHDISSDSKRGKPASTIGANMYSFVGAQPPTDARAYHFEGMTTKSYTDILFPDTVASGATVWLCAGWVGTRGEVGISCDAVMFTLQGGSVRAAA